jgi:hypothetical protein
MNVPVFTTIVLWQSGEISAKFSTNELPFPGLCHDEIGMTLSGTGRQAIIKDLGTENPLRSIRLESGGADETDIMKAGRTDKQCLGLVQ